MEIILDKTIVNHEKHTEKNAICVFFKHVILAHTLLAHALDSHQEICPKNVMFDGYRTKTIHCGTISE